MTPQPPGRAPGSLIGLSFLVTAVLAGMAWRHYQSEKDVVSRAIKDQLLLIADSKARDIGDWRRERLSEARMMAKDRPLMSVVSRLIAGRASVEEQRFVPEWLETLCRERRYAGATLTDAAGHIVMRRGRTFGDDAHIRRAAARVVATGEPELTEFHLGEPHAPAHLGLNIPLRREAGASAFGALVLSLDPEDYLFPLLARWPVQTGSAEAMLVRQDGSDVVFLSPLRKHPLPAANLRIPVSPSDVDAARAVAGAEGPMDAVDYRGAPVFAASRAAPGTTWRVVAKMDAEEALTPLRRRDGFMGVLAVLLAGLASIGVFALWRRRESGWRRERHTSEQELRRAGERLAAEHKASRDELRAATAIARENEARYRAVFEQPAAAMKEVSLDGRILRVNQRYCQITGHTRDELLRLGYADLTHPADRAAEQQRVHALAVGEKSVDCWQTRIIHKDGSVVRVAVTASLARGSAGEPLYLLETIEDITSAVLAEDELRQSEERFRQAAEHAPIGLMVVTATEIRYLNPAAVKLFAAESAAQLTGASVLDRVFAEDRAKTRSSVATIAAGAPVTQAERRYLRLNGEAFIAEVSAAPISYEGRPSALVFFREPAGVGRGDEERPDRRRHAQELESLSRLTRLLAHDFNNHLTVINGYSDMLLEALGPDDPLAEEIGEIRAASGRASTLARQLLALDRQPPLQPGRQSLIEVAETQRSRLARLVGDKIDVELRLDPALGLVLADRKQVEQVLVNLAAYARAAMPDGGVLAISAANVEIEQDDPTDPDVKRGAYVALAVSDSAPDQPPEAVRRAFGDAGAASGGPGMNFGLALVNGIVRQCGGFIRIPSRTAPGAKFEICLPRIAAPKAALRLESRGVDGPRRRAATVLIAIQECGGRRLAVDALERRGYLALEASNEAEALRIAESEPVDLLVTDAAAQEWASRLAQAWPAISVLCAPAECEPDRMAAMADQLLASRQERPKVLVIDDDDAIRRLLATILVRAGYDVCLAGDGEEGLRVVEQRNIHLVITDLVMPGQDGLETVKLLRKRLPQVRIIAISGAFHGELLKAAGILGAEATFVKPVPAEQLLSVVRKLIG